MLCHACLQMALHEEARAKKKARKIASSSGFASAVGPSRMLVAEKGSAVGNHCFCGSASLGCVLRFAISLGTARLRPNAALVGLPRMVYQFPCKCAQFSCGRGSSSSRTNMLLRAVLISWLALRLHLQCTARLHIQSLIRLSRHGDSFNVGPLKLVARQRRIWCRAVYSSSQWPSHYQLNNPPSFYPSSPPGNGIELIPNKHRPHPAASTLPLLIVGQNGSH
ncbi:hypothetical protein LI328DRAFT_49808 [Trichoderma asperelloides]|nr:hypothetical protein LI328DRAFT_49808 [Trichoderma asperelloides]